ncbi:RNA polymerase sigma factor [Polyangium fumosum]|uniref:Sigma-70 family RNA polymerase sigma factor n=1 Tax=Polyangium fumosum TaxID=889272 RepID=A0A4U1J0G7_9BACT|nr:sigma-70 family RNA polymerase sigma factor [Polyangium fumosum]TKC99851.1 sigma-70 family RNA polymerase sigma factor [Polyangium fumosum]
MTRRFDTPDGPHEQLAQLALRVPGWLARLPPPWGPVPLTEVEDLGQEVLTVAVAGLPRYDPAKGSMAVWLYAITQRKARDWQVREQYRGGFSVYEDVIAAPSGARNPEEAMATAQYVRLVHETIGEMDADLREVLTAVELGELSHEETAQLVGVSKRTVKDRLERAREDFTRRIKRKMRDNGMVVLPFAADGLFAFLRARTEDVPEELRERLRAIVEQGPGAAQPEAPATAPDGDAPGTGQAGSDAASFLGGNITGGIVGAVVVYLLTRPVAVMPEATRSHLDERIPPAVAAFPVTAVPPPAPPPPAPPPSSMPRPADPAAEARALLNRAVGALEQGDLADARAAFERYDRRFPSNPLPKVRAFVLGELVRAERPHRAP